MRNPITGILHIYTSARDRNGNCYHSAIYIDTATGASVKFRDIGGASNMDALPRLLGSDVTHAYRVHEVLPIREYNRLTRDWPYQANHADERAAQIVKDAIDAAQA